MSTAAQRDERNLRSLRRAYSGIWGHKVFWLALLTVGPIFIVTRVLKASVTFSFPLALFAIYHSAELINWATVRHLDDENSERLFSPAERSAAIRRAWRIALMNKALGGLVGLIVLVQTVLLLDFAEHRLGAPTWVYDWAGIAPPIESYSAELREVAVQVAGNATSDSDPCAKVTRWPFRLQKQVPGRLVCELPFAMSRDFGQKERLFENIVSDLERYPRMTYAGADDRQSWWIDEASGMEVAAELWIDQDDQTRSEEQRKRAAWIEIRVENSAMVDAKTSSESRRTDVVGHPLPPN